jgi:hypothetical protein
MSVAIMQADVSVKVNVDVAHQGLFLQFIAKSEIIALISSFWIIKGAH